MSDLRPMGVPIRFNEADRRFLFDFTAIDELQSRHPGSSIFDLIEKAMQDTVEGLLDLIDLTDVLCRGEVQREIIPSLLRINTLTGEGSVTQVRSAISLALIESMPKPDEFSEPKDGTGMIETEKFIVIAMSKFGMCEEEAWRLTPRKFGLLNDAYMEVNGMKKAEDTMSLSALP